MKAKKVHITNLRQFVYFVRYLKSIKFGSNIIYSSGYKMDHSWRENSLFYIHKYQTSLY